MENKREFVPRLIAWEITRKCHLACKHCRGGARDTDYTGELTTDEALKLLDNIATFNEPIIIILTGGEPMARDDVFEIARYGTDLGLRMVMSPCGQLIDDESAEKIKASGIQRLSFSIDGATAESHDSFRGVPGAFEGTMRGIEICKKHGIEYQVNTTVTKLNVDELPDILELSLEIGAVAFNPFLLVPTGRGSDLVDMELSPDEYERVLDWVRIKAAEVDLFFKPTCAPHYHRIIRQKKGPEPKVKSPMGARMGQHPGSHGGGHRVKPSGHPGSMSSLTRGCMGGVSFAFISHIGEVQICGFLPVKCGDVREKDFVSIWDTSEVFLKLRDYSNIGGKCGRCEFIKVCGGCRARAYAVTGDYLAEEPLCSYEPGKRAESL